MSYVIRAVPLLLTVALARCVSPPQTVVVSAEIANSRVFVECRVNGSIPLPFLLDTGASESVLNADRLTELGLQGGAGGKASVEGGEVETESVRGVVLVVADATLPPRAVAALSLRGVEAGLGHKIYGILGGELFAQRVVTIDYEKRTVSFSTTPVAHGSEIPISIEEGTPIVWGSIDGQSGRFQIDTGGGMAVVNAPFLAAHPGLVPVKTLQMTSGAIMPGRSRGGVGRAGLLQIGQFRIERPIINYSQNTTGDRVDVDAGLIGGEVLGRFSVTLDYANKRLRLEPNAMFGTPIEFNGSGLGLGAEGPDFSVIRVRTVIADSPADEADIRAGDRIVSVNGASRSLEELRHMLSDITRAYEVLIERAGSRMPKRLVQRRLI